MAQREEVKKYWDERARKFLNNQAATTDDVHLRELEIRTIKTRLKSLDVPDESVILDVGCGDGYSTIKVAQGLPNFKFVGIDYSEHMVAIANQRLMDQPDLKSRISFSIGSVLELDKVSRDLVFDVAISDRCLINLDSAEEQSLAISLIASRIKPAGYYIAIENFVEGQSNMNNARREVGLPEIPVRWHNLYFKEGDFAHYAEPYFDDIVFKDFSSSYYFATRVIYSAMCKMRGEEPDYDHEIHRLAVNLPWVGQFSPVRMVVLRRKSS